MSKERMLEIAVWLAGLVVELAYYGMSSAAVYCQMTQEEVTGELRRLGPLASAVGELGPEVVE